jgi:hypothetical protein
MTVTVLKRQILLMTCSLTVSFVLAFVVGFLIGLIINMLLFAAAVYYIRPNRLKVGEKLNFKDKEITTRNEHVSGNVMKLKYTCLVCSSEVSDVTCKRCGSHMKKAVF